MRMAAIFAMAGLAGMSAGAGEAEEPLTVYLSNTAIVPSEIMMVSQNLAARMFVSAGVRIVWRIDVPADLGPGRDRAIVIRMAEDTPKNYLPGAVAFALPYQGEQITVFYDRLEQAVVPFTAPTLLAHVMVHEITHILQRVNRHFRKRRHESALGRGRLQGDGKEGAAVYRSGCRADSSRSGRPSGSVVGDHPLTRPNPH